MQPNGDSPETMIGCNVLVDNVRGGIAMGKLTYIEGDIMEVAVPRIEDFEVGLQVRITVYGGGGKIPFHSTIVALFNSVLIILIPVDAGKLMANYRFHMRVPADHPGLIHTIYNYRLVQTITYANPLAITVYDIGLGGIGFRFNQPMLLPASSQLLVELHFDRTVLCNVEIAHTSESPEGLRYGAQFVNIAEKHMNTVRSFIMKQQILTRMELAGGSAGAL